MRIIHFPQKFKEKGIFKQEIHSPQKLRIQELEFLVLNRKMTMKTNLKVVILFLQKTIKALRKVQSNIRRRVKYKIHLMKNLKNLKIRAN